MPTKEQAPQAQKTPQSQPQPVVEGMEPLYQEPDLSAAVQHARHAPGLLSPEDVSRLQQTSGNRAVTRVVGGAIQRRAARGSRPLPGIGVQTSHTVVQRLKDNSKDDDEQDVDISALTYEVAHEYMTMIRENKLDSQANTHIEYTAQDVLDLEERIKATVGAAEAVRCVEGEAVEAKAGQEIDFVLISSCMAIACTFEDGSKVAAHDSAKNRVPGGGAIVKLEQMVQTQGKKVAKVRAVGVGGAWSPTLETQAQVMSRLGIQPTQESLEKSDKQKVSVEMIDAPGKDTEFVQNLQGAFKCQDVKFEPIEGGRPKVTAEGKFETEVLYERIQKVISDKVDWETVFTVSKDDLIEALKGEGEPQRNLEQRVGTVIAKNPALKHSLSGW